jgi:hypothetical protein
MPRITALADALRMSAEQCRAYVREHRIADPHPGRLGDLSDPEYRVWIRSHRAR